MTKALSWLRDGAGVAANGDMEKKEVENADGGERDRTMVRTTVLSVIERPMSRHGGEMPGGTGTAPAGR